MRDLAEVVRQIAVYHFVVAPVQEPVDAFHRIMRAAFRPVSVLLRLQVGFKDRHQHQQGRRLRHPVPDRRDPQGPERPGVFLRDQHLPHR